MCCLSINLGASTSWNPKGLSRPVMGLLYLYVNITSVLLVLDKKLTDDYNRYSDMYEL
jgi:hypothetical protein